MSGFLTDCLFVIDPDLYDPDNGYQLCIIWQGCAGIYAADYFCGHDLDLAIEYANDLNEENGHMPDFTTAVLELESGLNYIRFYNA